MDFKTALQYAILSQDIYQDFANIRFRGWSSVTPTLIQKASTDTQLAILEDPAQQLAVIVFRGSDAEKDWNTNLQFDQAEQEWSRQEKKEFKEQMKAVTETVAESKDLVYPDAYGEPSRPVRMHSGFITAYLSVRDGIQNYVSNSSATQYHITGHSLGGALATLCAIDIQYNFGDRVAVEAYTFGSPRVGNGAFVESYNRRIPNTWRVVNGWDAIVGVPVPWQGYRHVDTAINLERRFTWRIITGSFQDHRIDYYIEALRERA
ncbi:MAG: lipase family protein [Phormidesmis sp. RL_2_1]|nr:lipase family protein [Phormidesmis sp. RL_2_1]